jgi:dynein light chain roadblock-type
MNYETDTTESAAQKNVEDVARMVFSFVSAAGALVEDMDSEDGLKLLRLRTRKNEIIIVPGQLFSLLF